MAIKWLENNSYYKVIYEESYVKNNKVYINIQQYLNQDEREKEKSRLEEQREFVAKLNDKIFEHNADEINEYSYFGSIYFDFYKYTCDPIEDYSNKDFSLIEEIGFKKEWIINPVMFIGSMTVECGDFDNCAITHNYLYAKLKSRMNNIEDC